MIKRTWQFWLEGDDEPIEEGEFFSYWLAWVRARQLAREHMCDVFLNIKGYSKSYVYEYKEQ